MPPETSRQDTAQDTPVPAQVDVLVVGGGINGAGIARDLAGRGWQVLLWPSEPRRCLQRLRMPVRRRKSVCVVSWLSHMLNGRMRPCAAQMA